MLTKCSVGCGSPDFLNDDCNPNGSVPIDLYERIWDINVRSKDRASECTAGIDGVSDGGVDRFHMVARPANCDMRWFGDNFDDLLSRGEDARNARMHFDLPR